MSVLAIEINDSSLTVVDGASVLVAEPGYALVENGRIVTGSEAYASARLKPRQISNRHWSSLSMEPGSAGLDGRRSAAELAYAQLDSVWKRVSAEAEGAIIVAPGDYGRERLGVLLGIAHECGIPVRAMVDAAVAASVRPYPARQLLYLDASLHRVSVTVLDQSEGASARFEQAVDSGLASLTDQFARRIAEIFVATTRFDPFHEAQAEQALYDRLPGLLETLSSSESADVSVPHRGEQFSVTVERDQLRHVASGFYRAIVQLVAQSRAADSALLVQVNERLASLPGLAAELARLDDAHVDILPAAHAAHAALDTEAARAPAGAEIKWLKHLPWRAAATALDPAGAVHTAPAAPRARDELAATHVVYRGCAYRVGGDGLMIGREATNGQRAIVVGDQGGVSREHALIVLRDGELKLADRSRYGTFVNEKRISGEIVLKPADVIRIGSPGAELLVVGLENHGGT